MVSGPMVRRAPSLHFKVPLKSEILVRFQANLNN